MNRDHLSNAGRPVTIFDFKCNSVGNSQTVGRYENTNATAQL